MLRTFAITVFANIRSIDRFGRYGGEEFLLVLPDTPHDGAARMLDRLRAIIADLDWSAFSPGMQVTISAGVATLRPERDAGHISRARRQRALHSQGTRTQPHRQRLIQIHFLPATKKPSPAPCRTLQDRVMSSKSAATSENLLDELQATLAHGTVARRVETLRRVTDLFINGAVDFSDEQIALFDDVFQCLIEHIETSAKALLANRLAPIDTRAAADHPRAGVRRSDRGRRPRCCRSRSGSTTKTLIETARSKSQAHLMAISTRRVLSGAVTDVLVLRGNDEVVQNTVNNPGAEFSERGFTRLVNRAEGDDDLATCIGLRPDHAAPSLPQADRQGLGDGAGAARGRQPAASRATCPTAVREATQRARSAPRP